MEFTVRREDLVRGLYLVQGVVERRNTLPILSNVLVEPAGEGIALTATDMEVGLRGVVVAEVRKKGAVTLNARKLYEIVREVTAEEVVLKSAQAGWVEVLAGRSKFKIVSLDAKDFPQLPFGPDAPQGTAISIAAGTLREMIDRTLFAVSSDETRFNLSGVFLGNGEPGTLRMVATDGHRLALIDRRLPNAKIERGVMMPRKGLVEARKLLDDAEDSEVTMLLSPKDVRLVLRSTSFFMRLIEGEFPDYRQVIPGTTRVQARANRDDFLAALRRISLLASERSHLLLPKMPSTGAGFSPRSRGWSHAGPGDDARRTAARRIRRSRYVTVCKQPASKMRAERRVGAGVPPAAQRTRPARWST